MSIMRLVCGRACAELCERVAIKQVKLLISPDTRSSRNSDLLGIQLAGYDMEEFHCMKTNKLINARVQRLTPTRIVVV